MITSVWRDIAGYEGRYQVDIDGNVRHLWRNKPPTMLRPYRRNARGGHRASAREFVKLTGFDGKARDVAVINIVVAAWLGGKPARMVAYHKNGDTSDHNMYNIGFISPVELGRRTGAMATRKPVRKVTETGETVAIYPSARAAARDNYYDDQTVLDRCNGRVKKPFKLTGYSFEWDDQEVDA